MVVSSDRIVIPLSRVKLLLLLAGSAACCVVTVWLWTVSDSIPHRNPLVVRGVVIVAIMFLVVGILVIIRKLFDTAPGLVIDADGIVDNASGVSAGRVPWSDISGFKITTVGRQHNLTVEVRDPEFYVRRASVWKRWLVASSARFYGSPVQIPISTLQTTPSDLLQIVTTFHARYGGA